MSTWTYSGNPANSLVDQVRFLIGDTKKDTPLFLDGEIAWVLNECGCQPLLSAIRCVEVLIAQASSLVDQSLGPASISLSQRIANLSERVLPTLRRRLAIDGAQFYAGGQSMGDKAANNANRDLVHSQFDRRIFDPRSFSVGPIHHDADGLLYRPFGDSST